MSFQDFLKGMFSQWGYEESSSNLLLPDVISMCGEYAKGDPATYHRGCVWILVFCELCTTASGFRVSILIQQHSMGSSSLTWSSEIHFCGLKEGLRKQMEILFFMVYSGINVLVTSRYFWFQIRMDSAD